MAHQRVRRFCALLLAVILVVTGATQRVQASDMTIRMTAATGDMPMPGECVGCTGNDHGTCATACFALCGGVAAVLPLPTSVAATVLLSPLAAPVVPMAGCHGPPDPYPPRPTI